MYSGIELQSTMYCLSVPCGGYYVEQIQGPQDLLAVLTLRTLGLLLWLPPHHIGETALLAGRFLPNLEALP